MNDAGDLLGSNVVIRQLFVMIRLYSLLQFKHVKKIRFLLQSENYATV